MAEVSRKRTGAVHAPPVARKPKRPFQLALNPGMMQGLRLTGLPIFYSCQ